MNSAVTVQQQRPAAFWIYTGFIAAEIVAFVGSFTPFVSLVGFAMLLGAGIWAYAERGRDSILDTHYRFQIRTFWINFVAAMVLPLFFFVAVLGSVGHFLMGHDNPTSLVFGVIAGVFLPVLVSLALAIWTTFRSVVGLIRLTNGRPIDNPTTWTI